VTKRQISEFAKINSRGFNAMGIEEGDELVAARITDGTNQIFLASHEGMAMRVDEEKVRAMGRQAYGVKGMKLKHPGDYVVGLAVTRKKLNGDAAAKIEKAAKSGDTVDASSMLTSQLILTVTENGFGKRTEVMEYRLVNRGAQGVVNLKPTEKSGKVASVLLVDEQSDVVVISQYGKIIRIDSKTIRETGRSARGVRLLSLDPDDKVAAAVVIPPEDKVAPPDATLLQ
jgi:DNA gyrase subunit A